MTEHSPHRPMLRGRPVLSLRVLVQHKSHEGAYRGIGCVFSDSHHMIMLL